MSTARVAPILLARSRRKGFTSVTTTLRAPAWATTAHAMSPMGPAPVIKHILAEHVEFERRVDCIPEGIENGGDLRVQRFLVPPHVRLGYQHVVGECSRQIHPDAPGVLAQVTSPGEAVATAVADHMTLGADQLSHLEAGDVGAQTDDLSRELVPHGHRGRNRGPGPVVPIEDMHVGATDPGRQHPDQDVIGPWFGDRDVVEAQPHLVGMFHKSPHRPER